MRNVLRTYPFISLPGLVAAFVLLGMFWASPVSAQPPPCADLVITEFKITPTEPVQGQAATIQVKVKNQGTCDSLSFVVQWKSSQLAPTGPSASVPDGVKAGKTETIDLSYNFPDAGNFTTVVNVDTQNTVLETNESNNLAQLPVTVIPNLPDLVIEDFYVNPPTPVAGANTTINIRVRNQKASPDVNAAAGPFVVQWKFDKFAPTGPSQEVPGLAAGAFVDLAFNYIFPNDGDFQTQVNVDTDNTVAEMDENNNLQIFAVQVGEAKPDLEITGFEIGPEVPLPPKDNTYPGYPNQPVAGENAKIWVRVTNTGNAPALSFVVQWKSDEFAALGASSATVPGLGVGDYADVYLIATFRRAGNFETLVEIDTDRTVDESDEINNLQITPVTVQPRVVDVAVTKFLVEPANPDEASLPKFDEDGNPLPLNPVVDRLSKAKVRVRNLGNVPVDSFFTEWKPRLIEAGLNQQIIGGLDPGATENLSWDYIFRNTGTFTTRATADSSNTVAPEVNNDNNVATLEITVEPQLPDLEIVKDEEGNPIFYVNPPSPVAGTEDDLISTFTVRVRNRGNSAAGPFDVQVRPAPLAQVLTQQVVAGLGVHEAKTLQFTNVYRFPGTFNAVATLDPPIQRVAELDEQNNTEQLEVVVRPPTDDLDVIDVLLLRNPGGSNVVSSACRDESCVPVTCPEVPSDQTGDQISASKLGKATVYLNEPIKVCIYVQNLGNSPMRQFMVEFNPAEGVFPPLNSSGPATLKTQVDELGAGQMALIENDYVYERAGEFRTLTFADSDRVIPETNEENNREIYYVDVIGTGPDLTITDLIVTHYLGEGFGLVDLPAQGDGYQILDDGKNEIPYGCYPGFGDANVQASVSGAEPTLQQGQQAYACVWVRNQLNFDENGVARGKDSGPFVTQWNPDTFGLLNESSQTLASQMANLGPGQTALLIFPYTYTKAGNFRTLAKADAHNDVAELQEGDNEKVLNVVVEGTGPDLIISSMKVDKAEWPAEPTLTQGKEVEVTLKVRNVGNRAAGPFVVEWNPDAFGLITPSPGTLSEQVDGLAPFATKTVKFKFEYNEHGEFRSVAKADAFNNVNELNEANNLMITNVIVDPAPLDLTIQIKELIALPKDDGSNKLVRGSPIVAVLTVTNNGNYPTGSFSVQWKPQGEFAAGGPFVRVDGLYPNESRDIETPQSSFFTAGPFATFAEVDVFDEIIETNENNNTATKQVNIEPRETNVTVSFNNPEGLKIIDAGGDGTDKDGEWRSFVLVLDPGKLDVEGDGATCTQLGDDIEDVWCAKDEDDSVDNGDTLSVGSHTFTLHEGVPLVVVAAAFEVDDFLGIPTGGRFTGYAFEFFTAADYRGAQDRTVPGQEGDGCSGGHCFDLKYDVTINSEPPELADGSGATPQQIVLPIGLKKLIPETALPAGVVYEDSVDEGDGTDDGTDVPIDIPENGGKLFLPSIHD